MTPGEIVQSRGSEAFGYLIPSTGCGQKAKNNNNTLKKGSQIVFEGRAGSFEKRDEGEGR